MECGGQSDSNCSSGSGCAGCGCGGSSTPFLQRILSNGDVEILNDVMVTSPSSMFHNPDDGAAALERGDIGSDIYPVSISDADNEQEKTFQLKEIEYETSAIAQLSYAKASISKEKEVALDYSHQNVQLISNERPVLPANDNLKANLKSVFLRDSSDFKNVDTQPTGTSLLLNPNEGVQFTVTKNTKGGTHLAVAAFFHHLHTGGVQQYLNELKCSDSEAIKSVYQKSFLRKHLPVVGYVGAFLAAFMPFTSSLDDANLLQLSYSVPEAHAEQPSKSLYYYYKNTAGKWVYFSTMHPRYKLTHRVTVQIPEEAFAEGREEVEVKVVSNSKHYIYSMGLVDTVESVELGEFTPISGHLNNEKEHSFEDNSGLITQPGDEFRFAVTNVQSNVSHIFFKIHGHYSPLVCGNENDALQWWEKLTPQERRLLKA